MHVFFLVELADEVQHAVIVRSGPQRVLSILQDVVEWSLSDVSIGRVVRSARVLFLPKTSCEHVYIVIVLVLVNLIEYNNA